MKVRANGRPCQNQVRSSGSSKRPAERVLRGVGPNEIGDVAIGLDAVDDEAEQQRAFENDRDGLVAEPLHRVEGVAEQRGVRGEDHQRETWREQEAEARDVDKDREHDQARDRHQRAQRHDVAEVALDLGRAPRPLAHEQDVEAEVEHDADDRRVVDEGGEGSVVRGTKVLGGRDNSYQRDETRNDLRREH